MPSITYTISDEFYEEVKDDFLIAHPVPKDENGELIMSAGEWIREWGRMQFVKARKLGKRIKAHNLISIPENWIS